jgi:hypothetical protein
MLASLECRQRSSFGRVRDHLVESDPLTGLDPGAQHVGVMLSKDSSTNAVVDLPKPTAYPNVDRVPIGDASAKKTSFILRDRALANAIINTAKAFRYALLAARWP